MTSIPNIQSYQLPRSDDLPSSIPNWKIDPNRAVLLLHDVQKFFIDKIDCHIMRNNLLTNVATVRQRCQTSGIPIAYTAQPGSMTLKQRGLLKSFWGRGMKASQSHKQIVEPLLPHSKDWILVKWRYSAFHNTDLLQRMRDLGRDQLIICGVYAHIGVLTTALESFSNDIETFIVADAVGDFNRRLHMMALNHASRCCAVNLLTQEVLA